MNVPTRVPADIAVTLVPGNGIVIRTTSFLCVLGEGSRERADAVLALGRNHPEFAGDARRLVRSLVDDLGDGQGEPADIAIAATDDLGVALYLSGSMFADMNGRLLADAGSGRLELAVPWNFDSLGLYTAGVDTSGAVDAMFTLGEGAVPAAGAVIGCPVEMRVTESYRSVSPEQMPPRKAAAQPIPTPRSAPIPKPSPIPHPIPEPVPTPIHRSTPIPGAMAAPVSTADSARGETMPDVPTAHFTMAADEPMLVSLTDGDDAGHHDDPARDKNDPAHDENDEAGVEPLPVVSGDPASAMDTTAEHHGPPVIHGIRCSRGHLNHPQSLLRGSCGIRMDQLTHIIVEGERPHWDRYFSTTGRSTSSTTTC